MVVVTHAGTFLGLLMVSATVLVAVQFRSGIMLHDHHFVAGTEAGVAIDVAEGAFHVRAERGARHELAVPRHAAGPLGAGHDAAKALAHVTVVVASAVAPPAALDGCVVFLSAPA